MAADIRIQTVGVDFPGSGQFVNVTIDGFGTPKAVILLDSLASTASQEFATPAPNYVFNAGFAEPNTLQYNQIAASNDALSSTRAGGWQGLAIFQRIDPATPGTTIFEVDIDSWITDGVRLKTQKGAGGLGATLIFIGGDDVINASVNLANTGAGNAAVPVSVGFEPTLVFSATSYQTAGEAGTTGDRVSFGVSVNRGGVFNKSNSYCAPANQSTTSLVASSDNNAISHFYSTGVGESSLHTTALGNFSASGFDLVVTGTGYDRFMQFLSIELSPEVDLALIDTQIPTSGDYIESGFSFEPIFRLMGTMAGPSAYNTPQRSGVYANSITMQTVEQGALSISMSNEDTVDTSVVKRGRGFKTLVNAVDGSGYQVESSSDTFTSNGWTSVLTANPSSPVLGWALAIGADGAATLNKMYIKDGGIFKHATPYIKEGGVFVAADAYVRSGGAWVKVQDK